MDRLLASLLEPGSLGLLVGLRQVAADILIAGFGLAGGFGLIAGFDCAHAHVHMISLLSADASGT